MPSRGVYEVTCTACGATVEVTQRPDYGTAFVCHGCRSDVSLLTSDGSRWQRLVRCDSCGKKVARPTGPDYGGPFWCVVCLNGRLYDATAEDG